MIWVSHKTTSNTISLNTSPINLHAKRTTHGPILIPSHYKYHP
jgi:hypothetical protein